MKRLIKTIGGNERLELEIDKLLRGIKITKRNKMSHMSLRVLAGAPFGGGMLGAAMNLLAQLGRDKLCTSDLRVYKKCGRAWLVLYTDTTNGLGTDSITYTWYRDRWVLVDFSL